MARINELKQKIGSDAGFRESLQKSADAKDLMDKIKAAGFDVTPEELVSAVSGKNGEVSDDALEAVAGGMSEEEWFEYMRHMLTRPFDPDKCYIF